MGEKTNIAWATDTWNWVYGCSKVSPGCLHCYAETLVNGKMGGDFSNRTRTSDATFNAPLRWQKKPWVCNKCGTAFTNWDTSLDVKGPIPAECCWHMSGFHRRRVFSLSLGDWLDPKIPVEWLADALDIIHRCPDLDFLLLTKRPELFQTQVLAASMHLAGYRDGQTQDLPTAIPKKDAVEVFAGWSKLETFPHNVWLGVSAEDQKRSDQRRDAFKSIPAAVKFVSYEPALTAVDWTGWEFVNQIIFGGESGVDRRPCDVEWAVSTLQFCNENGIAFFCKQDSAARPGMQGRIPDSVFSIKQFPNV